MHLKTALLLATTLAGCAGIDASAVDTTAGSAEDAALFGNPGYTEIADYEHVLVLDASGNTDAHLAIDIEGQALHRVVFDVREQQQRVQLVLDAPRTESGRYPLHRVVFHGDGWGDAPPVEMRMARELAAGHALDVVLAPGRYAFDFVSYRAAEDEQHTLTFRADVEPAGTTPTFDTAPRRSVGAWVSGELAFGESALYRLEGADALGLAAASRDLAAVCSRTWIEAAEGPNLEGTSTQTWRSLTSVRSDEVLYVELFGCVPGTSAYDHLVIDRDDYESL